MNGGISQDGPSRGLVRGMVERVFLDEQQSLGLRKPGCSTWVKSTIERQELAASYRFAYDISAVEKETAVKTYCCYPSLGISRRACPTSHCGSNPAMARILLQHGFTRRSNKFVSTQYCLDEISASLKRRVKSWRTLHRESKYDTVELDVTPSPQGNFLEGVSW